MKIYFFIVSISVLIFAFGCNKSDLTKGYKNALPKSATDISEKFIDAYPDWSYYLKAKITEDDFKAFIKEFNLEINLFKKIPSVVSYDSTKYKDNKYEKDYNKQYEGMQWWKIKNESKVFYKGNDNGETFATYEDGNLYFFTTKY